ncbi:MAG: hypothetical protein ACOX08_03345 [Methanobacterium sp.]|uniref:hypothetical protein n=1 Tax=Methanobacterium sp. MZD130B TaxID=3394378 RepID=UPI0039FC926B
MKTTKSLKMISIGVLIFGVLVSGCINSPLTEKKTFSDGLMSFDYPGVFNTENQEINNSKIQRVAYFVSSDLFNKQYINVVKNKTAISPTELRDETLSINRNSSTSEVLSSTTETNPNGIVVETIRMTIVYKENGEKTSHNVFYFEINDTVYVIGVYGPYSNKQQITTTANIIFQSIK